MILEIKVPSPGESINEVEIANWLVKSGDYVKKDQIIVEIDSDKATLEIVAEQSGIITLKALEGDTVSVGQVICLIDTYAKEKEEKIYKSSIDQNQQIKTIEIQKIKNLGVNDSHTYLLTTSSPAAKKIIKEQNLDITYIQGTGKSGRITKQDILLRDIKNPAMGTSPILGSRHQTITKLSSLRKKISNRLVVVKNETAMLTTFNEVDMIEVIKLRTKYKDIFSEKYNVGLGFMSFFVKSVIRGLELYPDINAMIDQDNKISNHFYDISIAVSGPKGLMVPVIRNAENCTFRGIEQVIRDLAIKVRDGKITVDEMTGGTFTITNGGIFGSMMSTPILNPPQSAILGMHNIIDRPVVRNTQIVIRPIMYLALSYDHRIIDGRESVGFLNAVKEAIENPIEILMNNDPKKALEL